jgi:hypothetical protein
MKTKLSSLSALVACLGIMAWTPMQAKAQVVIPLQIDEIVLQDGQLVALGSLGGTDFAIPLTASILDGDGICPILDLRLAPIDLNLLGLRVETSNIHLLVAAKPGEDNLLGNLLCGLAGLLDGPLDLGDLLAGLPLADRIALLEQIRDLLNAALEEITSTANIAGVSGSETAGPSHPGQGKQLGVGKGQGKGQGVGGGRATAPGQVKKQDPDNGNGNGNGDPGDGTGCDILNLVLGPVDLDLLGLIVHLDNCDNGPITVDITAIPGGGLLGSLLCALAGLLDGGLNLEDLVVQALVDAIIEEILSLLELP